MSPFLPPLFFLEIVGDSGNNTLIVRVTPDGDNNQLPDVWYSLDGGANTQMDWKAVNGVNYAVAEIRIDGLGGLDTIRVTLSSAFSAGGGIIMINGGTGDDTISVPSNSIYNNNIEVYGSSGNDTLITKTNGIWLDGGNDNDTYIVGLDNNLDHVYINDAAGTSNEVRVNGISSGPVGTFEIEVYRDNLGLLWYYDYNTGQNYPIW